MACMPNTVQGLFPAMCFYHQKIKAGDNRQGVLVFEVDQEINLSDVSLVAVRDDKQAEIAIK